MRTLDFAPLLRSSIGFENLNRLVDFATRGDSEAYPPYNIEKLSEDVYRISMAVAGFSRDELELVVQDNVLVIVGKAGKGEESGRQFLHRGIAKRAFERRFQLADTIKVTGADYRDGLLDVELKREVPEHKKPRRIEIGGDAATGAPILDASVSEVREAA
ncbi:Hsp20 family protein [Sphingomonas sp.]|uniref:Hsp20 family protein n=1 Tax=Sphingomonas sp. TaxID=28214 RepID=UPI003B0047CD